MRKLKLHGRARFTGLVALLAAVSVPGIPAQATETTHPEPKESAVTMHASGPFEVKLSPQPPEDDATTEKLGRMLIDKQFHGDLEATSKGQMLSAMTDTEGSAGYVAIERVAGTLHGRRGTFVLQHSGTMTRGEAGLTVTVVPDSATGELSGLSGSMSIEIEDGKHFYKLEYSLDPAP